MAPYVAWQYIVSLSQTIGGHIIRRQAMRYVAFASTLVETHHDARIDSNPILAFLCVAFLRLIVENSLEKLLEIFAFRELRPQRRDYYIIFLKDNV